MEGFIILVVFILVVVTLVLKAIVLVPQGEAAIVERLGRYTQTLNSGLNFIIPIIDRVREKVDTRERMVTFPPQAVITEDNLTVAIDTVVTFQVNEPDRAIYGIDDYIFGVEQITTATLRDVVGGLTLEETLTSRDYINRRLRGELDEATAKWGLRIARVELKAIEPPPSIQQSMEKQMKADREKRAMIPAKPILKLLRAVSRHRFSPPKVTSTQQFWLLKLSVRQPFCALRVLAPLPTLRHRVMLALSRRSTQLLRLHS